MSSIHQGPTLDSSHTFHRWDTLIGIIPFLQTHACTINLLSINPSEVSARSHLHQVLNTTRPCGFLLLLTNNTLRFASGFPHILTTLLIRMCGHHRSISLRRFHLRKIQFRHYSLLLLSFFPAASPFKCTATTPVKQQARCIHTSLGLTEIIPFLKTHHSVQIPSQLTAHGQIAYSENKQPRVKTNMCGQRLQEPTASGQVKYFWAALSS